ncbi:hypothetical protein Sta7437_0811 [Stanieria cyanosphaera PCC 7437]|uniref:EF-hand domain-containing protein n=1 Tax=Stanieria cyanosphaera (strain ATCC 29371 / PCC 7437) TaxID=111780 RepID=K9XQN3_STAC7|nr:hypothetical protein [Stanieria cyanosphaera]AFZ34399.1 hypothetical protein Sta7437_0811 [Stanieria cyanosphaera PCC 7437]
MTSQYYWGITFPSAIPISVASLLLCLGISKPAFGSYFNFSRDYRNGLEKIKLAGKFQAKDLNGDNKISLTEVKSFEGMIVSQSELQPQIFSVFDLIKPKEEIQFEKFNYDLKTNNLQFVIRTLEQDRSNLINSINSYWQVDFQSELDSFKTIDNSLVALDYQGTGLTSEQSKNPSGLDSLVVLLILTLMFFRISQQIQAETKTNKEQQLKLSTYQEKWE